MRPAYRRTGVRRDREGPRWSDTWWGSRYTPSPVPRCRGRQDPATLLSRRWSRRSVRPSRSHLRSRQRDWEGSGPREAASCRPQRTRTCTTPPEAHTSGSTEGRQTSGWRERVEIGPPEEWYVEPPDKRRRLSSTDLGSGVSSPVPVLTGVPTAGSPPGPSSGPTFSFSPHRSSMWCRTGASGPGFRLCAGCMGRVVWGADGAPRRREGYRSRCRRWGPSGSGQGPLGPSHRAPTALDV